MKDSLARMGEVRTEYTRTYHHPLFVFSVLIILAIVLALLSFFK